MTILDDEVPEHSVDPRNLRAELVRYLTTAVKYVQRQGLPTADIEQIIKETLGPVGHIDSSDEIAIAKRPTFPNGAPIPELELADVGVNDMRNRIN